MVDSVVVCTQFVQNYSRLKKEHKTFELNTLDTILKKLINEESVQQYNPHPMKGQKDVTELHVTDDVLLLYSLNNNILRVELILNNIVNHDNLGRRLKNNLNIKKEISDVNSTDDVMDYLHNESLDDDMDFESLVAQKYIENPSRVGGNDVSSEMQDLVNEQASNAVDEFEDELDEEDLFASIASGMQEEQ